MSTTPLNLRHQAAAFVRNHGGTALLLTLFAVSLVLNLYQVSHGCPTDMRSDPTRQGVIGTIIGGVAVRSMAGETSQLRVTASKPTVIYFLSPTCSWCSKNHATISTLGLRAAERFRFVGLVRDAHRSDVSAYLRRYPLPFDVYLVSDESWLSRNDLVGTPSTLVVDTTARVTHVWHGAFTGEGQREVEALFHVQLPGVSASDVR